MARPLPRMHRFRQLLAVLVACVVAGAAHWRRPLRLARFHSVPPSGHCRRARLPCSSACCSPRLWPVLPTPHGSGCAGGHAQGRVPLAPRFRRWPRPRVASLLSASRPAAWGFPPAAAGGRRGCSGVHAPQPTHGLGRRGLRASVSVAPSASARPCAPWLRSTIFRCIAHRSVTVRAWGMAPTPPPHHHQAEGRP